MFVWWVMSLPESIKSVTPTDSAWFSSSDCFTTGISVFSHCGNPGRGSSSGTTIMTWSSSSIAKKILPQANASNQASKTALRKYKMKLLHLFNYHFTDNLPSLKEYIDFHRDLVRYSV